MKEDHQDSAGEKLLRTAQTWSTGFLLEWTGGMKRDSLDFFVGSYELDRRKQKWTAIRSWISVGISAVALVVAALALWKK